MNAESVRIAAQLYIYLAGMIGFFAVCHGAATLYWWWDRNRRK